MPYLQWVKNIGSTISANIATDNYRILARFRSEVLYATFFSISTPFSALLATAATVFIVESRSCLTPRPTISIYRKIVLPG